MARITLEIDTENLNSTALLLDGEKLGYICSLSIDVDLPLTEVRVIQLREIPGMDEERLEKLRTQKEKLRKLFPVVTLEET
jgi:hypothetical protein